MLRQQLLSHPENPALYELYARSANVAGDRVRAKEAIAATDSVVEIRVQYQLILDEFSPLIGFARFTLYKRAGDRFRILLWQDEF